MNPLLNPFWKGNEVLGESLLPVAGADGLCAPMPLMYAADEILSVRSAARETVYRPDKDYRLENGCLVIPAGSLIPVMRRDDYYLTEEEPGKCFAHSESGWIRFSEGSYFHERQIEVSYRHHDSWTGSIPLCKERLLPRTIKMLKEGRPLNILIFGDSISTGLNSSGKTGAPPYQKPWFDLAAEELAEAFHTEGIRLSNTSVSGQNTMWGRETAMENGALQYPDLGIIGFGMGDGNRFSKELYIENLLAIMEIIRSENPQCEFVLIATMLPNQEAKGFVGCQAEYLAPMLKLEKEGVCVADMTTFHADLMKRKAYRDMSGNNINHPNDFLSRAYAQVLLQTMGIYGE